MNHFGSKDALFLVAADRMHRSTLAARQSVPPDDVAAAVETLVADYEVSGTGPSATSRSRRRSR